MDRHVRIAPSLSAQVPPPFCRISIPGPAYHRILAGVVRTSGTLGYVPSHPRAASHTPRSRTPERLCPLCPDTALAVGQVPALLTNDVLPTLASFFFFTLVTGPRRSLSLKLSDTRVYEPQIRASPEGLHVTNDVPPTLASPEGLPLQHPRQPLTLHHGGNPGAILKSISHKCYLFEVAFVWELTKETIVLPLG